MKIWRFVIVVMVFITSEVNAEPRYQAVPLDAGYEFGTEKALLLDTLAGHMWIWVESPSVGDKTGGRYLIYQGQLAPGKNMGDIILQQQWQGENPP